MAICPGLVKTAFLAESSQNAYSEHCQAAMKSLAGKIPLLEWVLLFIVFNLCFRSYTAFIHKHY